MLRTILMMTTSSIFLTAAHAQTTPESVAEQLQGAGVEDIVIYNGRETLRATGTSDGTAVEFAFDRRTGEAIDLSAAREERGEIRGFIEGLRETYDEETDGSFRGYVAAAAAEAGIDLPDRPARGGGEDRPARGADGDRPSRGEAGDRPSRGEGGDRPSRGEAGDRPTGDVDRS